MEDEETEEHVLYTTKTTLSVLGELTLQNKHENNDNERKLKCKTRMEPSPTVDIEMIFTKLFNITI